MNSTFGTINWKDVAKGFSVSIIVAILGILQQMFTAHGFDFASFDWFSILDVAWKSGSAYLVKNLFSTQSGKFLGKIG